MIVKMPKLSKAEKILAILDYRDPCRVRGTSSWYLLYYNYEAEELAQTVRRNSNPSSVGKRVKELIDRKLEMEGREYRVDSENAERVAETIISDISH